MKDIKINIKDGIQKNNENVKLDSTMLYSNFLIYMKRDDRFYKDSSGCWKLNKYIK